MVGRENAYRVFGNLTSLKKKKNFSRRGMNLVSTSTNFAYMTSVKYATTAREEVSLYMTFGKFLIMTLQ